MRQRKLFTLLTGFYTLIAGYSFAQNANETRLLKGEPINKGKEKMTGSFVVNAKTTALQSRLVGVMNAMHNGAFYEPVDSFAYKYTGNRGGDLVSDMLKFDNGQQWIYNGGTGSYSDRYRYAQTFDSRSNILSATYEVWDAPSSSWKKDYKYLYTYDPNNNMTGQIRQNWNSTTNNWLNVDNILSTYDSKGNLLTQIYQTWIVSSESWRNETKYTFTYNDHSDYLSKLYQDWSTSGNVWTNQDQYLYTYDSSYNMLSEINMYWSTSGSAWRNSSKTSYVYNSGFNPISKLNQTWNSFGSGSWSNTSQNLYTYDTVAVNNLVKEVYQTWGSGWTNNEQMFYTYDAAGNRLTEQRQTWSGFPFSSWRNSYMHTSTYDSRRNKLSHLEQVWSTSSSAWVNNRMYNYTFNSYNQLTSRKSNTWNAGGFWFPTTSDYQNNYYYEDYGSTGVANTQPAAGELKLYPVPASNSMNIDLKWNKAQTSVITIFDMQGRVMAQFQSANTDTYRNNLDVNVLPAGYYIMRVKGENETMVQQFSVVH